jgi:hypothetical protein
MSDALVKQGRVAVGIAALIPVALLPLLLALAPEDKLRIVVIAAAASVTLSLPILGVIGLLLLLEHARLRWVSRRFTERTFARGPLGLVCRVEGRVEGARVTLERGSLAVEVASAFEGVLDGKDLLEIARSENPRPMLARLAREPQAREAASALLALAGRHVRVRIESNRAWIRGFPGKRSLEVARALVAIAGTRAFPLARSNAAATCPFCHDNLGARESEGTIRCPDCDSLHHTPCWREHGGCAIFGCARSPGPEAVVLRPDVKARA